MATIVLAAVGAAVGSALGGTVLGLSAAVVGRAVGATVGQLIDQRLMGAGSEVVETGRIDRFRLTGASEGAPVPRVWGRTRLGGHVIWATRFLETAHTSTSGGGGGKGRPTQPSVETTSYSYSVSLAIALCEGAIGWVGRVWADGIEIGRDEIDLRVYHGTEDQVPDPKIAAVEGAAFAPAYRGIAYVVIEDLALERFGNRVPQFSFEVMRAAVPASDEAAGLAGVLRAVALVPGTGEYALATTPVRYGALPWEEQVSANVHAPGGGTDLAVSLEQLRAELPGVGSALVVVSWFADDLRCGVARVKPKVEQASRDGVEMPWRVSGVARAAAEVVPKVAGRSIYGGTPADGSVVEAIRALRAGGQEAVFYPFLLMEQGAGNGLPDPYGGAEQAVLPWRGRITCAVAPGRDGSPDGTAAAAAQVAAFFGAAQVSDFVVSGERVDYVGPEDWGLRRMILHYAHLCAVAGGVEAFCIGSEMRGLTQVRGPGNSFPAVAAFRQLAAEVRAILSGAKIGYAADWSEYFGYHPQDGSGDVFFHLDPLWADPAVDFVGIDNYMPLSDWRDGVGHADAGFGAVHDLGYLRGNVAGGEGFDWFYDGEEARAAQRRTPIVDRAHGEDWVFRFKDLKGWWGNAHHDRVAGVRQAVPTGWVPGGKPIWFTEYGCAAIDKGTNEPNRFLDPKSSEGGLPRYSSGARDDLIQAQYYRAVAGHFADPANNPVSGVYGGPMVDMERAHAWAWDARPYPAFPGRSDLWDDAGNYARGHWLNGRVAAQDLGAVISEVCARAGVGSVDVSGVRGLVRGYLDTGAQAGRAVLQPLMLAHGVDAVERGGALRFLSRGRAVAAEIGPDDLALTGEQDSAVEALRAPAAEVSGRVRVTHLEADGVYEARAAEAVFPDEGEASVSATELPLVMTAAEGRAVAERWLAEARVARDAVRFALPPSRSGIGAGDVVRLDGGALWRVDRVEDAGARLIEAVRVEPEVHVPSDGAEGLPGVRAFAPALPVSPLFLDLPLMTGAEVPHAPHIAVTARPFPGTVAVYAAPVEDAGYTLNLVVGEGAVTGVTETDLAAVRPGMWDRGAPLRVRVGGALSSATRAAVLAGANLAAVGDGSAGGWELFQFAEAALVGEGVYELSMRLRGQAGTDGAMPAVWPAGSAFVLVTQALRQIEMPVSARRLARHYRIGPAGRPYDDPSFVHRVEAFDGMGLRPYAPAHLRVREDAGDLRIGWVRRTRVDGDSWESEEVPLGEGREVYRLRVLGGGSVLREVTVTAPEWTYPAAWRAADAGAEAVAVAQVSEAFGPGPFRTVTLG